MTKQILLLLFFELSIIHTEGQTHRVKMLFAGDAMQHQSQLNAAKQADGNYDYSKYFTNIKPHLDSVDVATVNLEVTLAGAPYTGYPAFGAPDEYAKSLKDIGFNFFLTANNHSADRRSKGIERTVKVLDSLHISHTGTFVDTLEREIYYPYLMLKDGIRIAMLNYTYGTNGIAVKAPNIVNLIDTVQIKKDIADSKRLGAHIVIANMHWGEEYVLKQNKEQTRLANFLVNNGVRIVMGNHPHVVQPVDIRKEDGKITSIIVYSLGNLISGMRTTDTSGGMIVKIDISKEPNQEVSIDNFDYSLVWTYKPQKDGKFTEFTLLNIEDYDNEEGKKMLGDYYPEMKSFATRAKQAIESLW